MLNINQIWNNILLETESKVSTLGYDLYVNPLKPVGIYQNSIVLLADTPALKNIVEKNYRALIEKAASTVFPSITKAVIITEDETEKIGKLEKEVNIPVSGSFVKNTEDFSQFRSDYTFENFVVGESNRYAYAVSSAVAENPGATYNPLFLWGGVGLGKTHLLHAIGNYVKRNKPEKKTIYVTTDNFTNELIELFKDKDIDARKSFREKYRNVDVLMIDDVQFLAGKEAVQEEFFHTFNELYLKDKQIVICSDRPPREIKDITERLRTRFSTGVVADIQPPDFETRIAILQKKCLAKNKSVGIDVLSMIAEKITTNIRDMEGVLSRIISYANLVGGDCNDMNIVTDALKDYTESSKETVSIDNVVQATCDYYNLDKEALIGKKKNKEIVVPRQICIYLICDILSIPLISIGQYFGGRDHTTIMHARDKISEEIKKNGNIAAQVQDIRDKIYNR